MKYIILCIMLWLPLICTNSCDKEGEYCDFDDAYKIKPNDKDHL